VSRGGLSPRARARSFAWAFRGLSLLAREPNARIHALASVLVVVFAVALGLPRRDWALLVLAMGAVWVAEAVNTALEAACDVASPDAHPLVARAKDVAAAGVLLAALAAAGVGFLVLGPPLLARLL